MGKLDGVLTFFARSKTHIVSLTILNFAVSIALIVLSIIQSLPIAKQIAASPNDASSTFGDVCTSHSECSNDYPFCYDGTCDVCDECHYCHDGIDDTCGPCGDAYPLYEGVECVPSIRAAATSDEEAWAHDCSMIVIHYISPFHIGGDYDEGCPWRSRNTIFRSVTASFLCIASVVALMQLFRSKYDWIWPVVRWLYWLLFVMLFVVVVLDAEGLNSGYRACKSDFKVDIGNGESVQVICVKMYGDWNQPPIYSFDTK